MQEVHGPVGTLDMKYLPRLVRTCDQLDLEGCGLESKQRGAAQDDHEV